MAVLLVLLALALLSLLHEVGHAVAARMAGLGIESFSIGLGPPMAQRRVGRTLVSVGVIPFGGYVRVRELAPDAPMEGRFRPTAVAARVAAIVAGPLANYAVAAALAGLVAAGWGIPTGRILGLEVTAVDSHAASLGMQPGDLVVKVGPRRVTGMDDLRGGLRDGGGMAVPMTVVRAGTEVLLTARPVAPGRWGVGAHYVVRPERVPATAAAAAAFGIVDPWRQAKTLANNAAGILRPSSPVRAVSPLGVAGRIAGSGEWDAPRILSFGVLLSMTVCLFNLLPIPGLDGGRLVLELAERIARRRMSSRTAIAMQVAGLIVLAAIWVFVFARDFLGATR